MGRKSVLLHELVRRESYSGVGRSRVPTQAPGGIDAASRNKRRGINHGTSGALTHTRARATHVALPLGSLDFISGFLLASTMQGSSTIFLEMHVLLEKHKAHAKAIANALVLERA